MNFLKLAGDFFCLNVHIFLLKKKRERVVFVRFMYFESKKRKGLFLEN